VAGSGKAGPDSNTKISAKTACHGENRIASKLGWLGYSVLGKMSRSSTRSGCNGAPLILYCSFILPAEGYALNMLMPVIKASDARVDQ
jgi:hypothetical protein